MAVGVKISVSKVSWVFFVSKSTLARVIPAVAFSFFSNDKLHDQHYQHHFSERELKWIGWYLITSRGTDIGVSKL